MPTPCLSEYLRPLELVVGSSKNSHFPVVRHSSLYATHVHIRILIPGIMPHIHRTLNPREPVLDPLRVILCIRPSKMIGVDRKIKHNWNPFINTGSVHCNRDGKRNGSLCFDRGGHRAGGLMVWRFRKSDACDKRHYPHLGTGSARNGTGEIDRNAATYVLGFGARPRCLGCGLFIGQFSLAFLYCFLRLDYREVALLDFFEQFRRFVL